MDTESFHTAFLPMADLLDRLDLLLGQDSRFTDLRRSYHDQDLSSLFRLLGEAEVQGSIEDLRKACIEKNLHSLFRLTQVDDLRKIILEDNFWSLWRLLSQWHESEIIHGLKRVYGSNLSLNSSSLSQGQIHSKLWLKQILEEHKLPLGHVFLCAGWYAILATMLFESKLEIQSIRSFDIDPSCDEVAKAFNRKWLIDNWRFQNLTMDIYEINYHGQTFGYWSNNKKETQYLFEKPDTIINTSCEHLADFSSWFEKIPSGTLVILQSNNAHHISDHKNCVGSLEDFAKQAPLSQLVFQGELPLPKYTRFMRIGYR